MSLIQECREAYGNPKTVVAESWDEINKKRYDAMDQYRQGLNNNLVFTELLNCDYVFGSRTDSCMLTTMVNHLEIAYREHSYFKHQEPTMDEVQDILIMFLSQLKTGEFANNGITSWCVNMIKSRIADLLRNKYREVSRNVDLCNYSYIVDIDEINPDEVLDETNLDPAVLYELTEEERVLKEGLSPRQLEAVEMKEDGFKVKEIAEVMKIEPGTVRSRLTESRHKLAALRASYKLKGATNDIRSTV